MMWISSFHPGIPSILIIFIIFPASTIAQSLLDMTYDFRRSSPGRTSYGTFKLLRSPISLFSRTRVRTELISTSTHLGTHIDAPCYIGSGTWRVPDIPVQRLIGIPAIRVDISNKTISNPASTLDVSDLEQWVQQNGPILPNSLLFIYTGWGRFYGDKSKYLGFPKSFRILNFLKKQVFPGISASAAQWIVDNTEVSGVGIDTISVDSDSSNNYSVHRILLGRNVYIIENVMSLDQLPTIGSVVNVAPMKIADACGAPVRLVASLGTGGGGGEEGEGGGGEGGGGDVTTSAPVAAV